MRDDLKQLPDQEELRRLFSYDPVSGVMRRRIRMGKKFAAGTVIGHLHPCGYIRMMVNGEYYWQHRIIWKMIIGNDPSEFIDHINGNKSDNRWKNLREATNGQNMTNVYRLQKNNTSGVRGVCWDAGHEAWAATVKIDGKQVRIGRFKDKSRAALARRYAEQKHYGEFAGSV